MLKINQLKEVVDSLEQKMEDDTAIDIKNTISSLQLFKATKSKSDHQTLVKKTPIKEIRAVDLVGGNKPSESEFKLDLSDSQSVKNDLDGNTPTFKGDYFDLFRGKEKADILKFAISYSASNYRKIEVAESNYLYKLEYLNDHKMGMHDKFALAFSCFILFFVGAPLGAIIRKGGMGLPMIIAVGLFLTYWFIGIFAKNSAVSGIVPTFIGSWLSTLILLPLGIMLTRNATSDKGVFNTDGIYFFFIQIWNRITPKKEKNKAVELTAEKIESKTITIVKLDEIVVQKLRVKHTKFSTVTFILYAFIIALFPVLKLNNAPELLPMVLVILLIGYVIFYMITFLNYIKIAKNNIENYNKIDLFIDFVFGFTSYILAYFYYKTEVKEKISKAQKKHNK